MQKLDTPQIEERLKGVPEWAETNGAIQRTVLFQDFAGAMAFVNKVAAVAEEMDHHPDILIRYNKVTLSLSTHDAGGITEKDFELAGKIDRVV